MSDKSLTLTQKRISNRKIFVYVCLALGLALDVAVFSVLVAYALPVKYWIVPLLFAVCDLGFSAVAVASNFRFGYFKPDLILYSIAVFALSLASFLVGLDYGGGSAYTAFALGVYPGVHLLFVVAVILTVVLSVYNGIKAKAIGFVAAAAMLAASAVYAVHLIGDGYFGQSLEQEARTLLYSYDEKADGYAVVGVESGNGSKIVIPESFDGKPVCSINCGVFNAAGVNRVELDCAPTVFLDNINALDVIKDELVIAVKKENLEELRNRFYKSRHERAVIRTEPFGLEENEIFVTFNFPTEDGDALYPTWYGKKGDTFELDSAAPQWYKHYDKTNVLDLYNAYHSEDKTIFDGFYFKGENIDRTELTDSYRNVEPIFDDVYQIAIGLCNDGAYESPQSYRFSYVNGAYDPYRYVVLSTADALTSSIPERTGFSLSWVRATPSGDVTLGSLSDHLKINGNADTVRIAPKWKLDAPSLEAINGNTTPVYGDTLSLSSRATHALSELQFKYEWYLGSQKIGGAAPSLEIGNIGIADGGEYSLRVTAYSEDNSLTTLTSTAIVSSLVNVQRRELHFTWDVPTNAVYSATEIALPVDYDASDVINGDSITYTQNLTSVTNAGTYNLNVSLTGDCATKYAAVADKTFTVARAPLTVKVMNLTKTYDGKPFQKEFCEYSVEGLLGSDALSYPMYYSSALNTGAAGVFPITVLFPSDSLTLNNYDVDYQNGTATINKRTITVTWNSGDLVYNGEAQGIEIASVSGAVEGDDVLGMFVYDPATKGIDVGPYEIRATLVSDNYTLGSSESVTCPYNITAREINLNWNSPTLVYNGTAQHPTVRSADNVAPRDSATLLSGITYTGAKVNAGTNYSVSAVLNNQNYIVGLRQDCVFTIHAKTISLLWSGGGSFAYNGATRAPTVIDITGAIAGEKDEIVRSIVYSGTDGTSLKNVGRTTVTAALANTNYYIEPQTSKQVLQVYAKEIIVAWSTGHFIYDGQPHSTQIVSARDAVAGEEADLIAGITYTYSDGGTLTDVGTTQVTARLNNKNYNASPLTVVLEVAKREVTLVWSATEFTYNGSEQAPTVIGVQNEVGSDEAKILAGITVSRGNADIGNYTVTATLASSVGNYKIASGSENCSYTIKAADNPTRTVSVYKADALIASPDLRRKKQVTAEGVAI